MFKWREISWNAHIKTFDDTFISKVRPQLLDWKEKSDFIIRFLSEFISSIAPLADTRIVTNWQTSMNEFV